LLTDCLAMHINFRLIPHVFGVTAENQGDMVKPAKDPSGMKKGYERLNMARYEKLTLIMPDEAATRLRELAQHHNNTVNAFVAAVVEDWLEKRRKAVRLGRRMNHVQDCRRVANSDSRLMK
jgi:hypothetical protein